MQGGTQPLIHMGESNYLTDLFLPNEAPGLIPDQSGQPAAMKNVKVVGSVLTPASPVEYQVVLNNGARTDEDRLYVMSRVPNTGADYLPMAPVPFSENISASYGRFRPATSQITVQAATQSTTNAALSGMATAGYLDVPQNLRKLDPASLAARANMSRGSLVNQRLADGIVSIGRPYFGAEFMDYSPNGTPEGQADDTLMPLGDFYSSDPAPNFFQPIGADATTVNIFDITDAADRFPINCNNEIFIEGNVIAKINADGANPVKTYLQATAFWAWSDALGVPQTGSSIITVGTFQDDTLAASTKYVGMSFNAARLQKPPAALLAVCTRVLLQLVSATANTVNYSTVEGQDFVSLLRHQLFAPGAEGTTVIQITNLVPNISISFAGSMCFEVAPNSFLSKQIKILPREFSANMMRMTLAVQRHAQWFRLIYTGMDYQHLVKLVLPVETTPEKLAPYAAWGWSDLAGLATKYALKGIDYGSKYLPAAGAAVGSLIGPEGTALGGLAGGVASQAVPYLTGAVDSYARKRKLYSANEPIYDEDGYKMAMDEPVDDIDDSVLISSQSSLPVVRGPDVALTDSMWFTLCHDQGFCPMTGRRLRHRSSVRPAATPETPIPLDESNQGLQFTVDENVDRGSVLADGGSTTFFAAADEEYDIDEDYSPGTAVQADRSSDSRYMDSVTFSFPTPTGPKVVGSHAILQAYQCPWRDQARNRFMAGKPNVLAETMNLAHFPTLHVQMGKEGRKTAVPGLSGVSALILSFKPFMVPPPTNMCRPGSATVQYRASRIIPGLYIDDVLDVEQCNPMEAFVQTFGVPWPDKWNAYLTVSGNREFEGASFNLAWCMAFYGCDWASIYTGVLNTNTDPSICFSAPSGLQAKIMVAVRESKERLHALVVGNHGYYDVVGDVIAYVQEKGMKIALNQMRLDRAEYERILQLSVSETGGNLVAGGSWRNYIMRAFSTVAATFTGTYSEMRLGGEAIAGISGKDAQLTVPGVGTLNILDIDQIMSSLAAFKDPTGHRIADKSWQRATMALINQARAPTTQAGLDSAVKSIKARIQRVVRTGENVAKAAPAKARTPSINPYSVFNLMGSGNQGPAKQVQTRRSEPEPDEDYGYGDLEEEEDYQDGGPQEMEVEEEDVEEEFIPVTPVRAPKRPLPPIPTQKPTSKKPAPIVKKKKQQQAAGRRRQ